jgi:hypothetical protein
MIGPKLTKSKKKNVRTVSLGSKIILLFKKTQFKAYQLSVRDEETTKMLQIVQKTCKNSLFSKTAQ